MKTLIIAFSLLIIQVKSQTLDFINLSNSPLKISATTSSTDGQNIYLSNGWTYQDNDVVFLSSILKYNIASNSWVTVNIDGVQPKRYLSSELIDNKLFLFNGKTAQSTIPDSYNNHMEIIDLDTNILTYGIQNPIPARNSGSATLGDKIFVFGGSLPNSQYSNKLYTYDVVENNWTMLANLPTGRETKGEIVNNKLYVIGGYNGTSNNLIDIYNIESNTWESPFVMPTGVSAHSTSVMGSYIFIIGDYDDLGQIKLFNTDLNELITVNNNMINRRHCSSEIISDQLYIFGGNQSTDGNSVLNSTQNASLIDFLNIKDITNIDFKAVPYPNPIRKELFFHSDKHLNGIKYKIYNSNGEFIKEGKILDRSIDLSYVESDIYFIQLFFESFTKTFKIVKL